MHVAPEMLAATQRAVPPGGGDATAASADRYLQWAREKTGQIDETDMKAFLPRCRRLADFREGTKVRVHDRMQQDYVYELQANPATHVKQLKRSYPLESSRREGSPKTRKFKPFALPADMLAQGVFCGKYLNDCMAEFPREWFEAALAADKLRPRRQSSRPRRSSAKLRCDDPSVNRFGVAAGQSLAEWRRKDDWIIGHDPRGWFQWYCRYCLGRRDEAIDIQQMRRWGNFKRFYHAARRTPKIRQGLLQWAYPPVNALDGRRD